jgi:hypothetical protein
LSFYLPPQAAGPTVRLLLEGHEIAKQTYHRPGAYTLQSAPLQSSEPVANVTIEVDRTFSSPPDIRELGIKLIALGFRQ